MDAKIRERSSRNFSVKLLTELAWKSSLRKLWIESS
jgi:hypothetical protein